MGNRYISFSKMPILFFIYLKKIANIRKYRKHDEYFPHSAQFYVRAYAVLPGYPQKRNHTNTNILRLTLINVQTSIFTKKKIEKINESIICI